MIKVGMGRGKLGGRGGAGCGRKKKNIKKTLIGGNGAKWGPKEEKGEQGAKKAVSLVRQECDTVRHCITLCGTVEKGAKKDTNGRQK